MRPPSLAQEALKIGSFFLRKRPLQLWGKFSRSVIYGNLTQSFVEEKPFSVESPGSAGEKGPGSLAARPEQQTQGTRAENKHGFFLFFP